jgi:hypothetical protein
MDITDASAQRMELGVEQLINGDSLSYHNVVFCWDKPKDPNELLVLSYSDCLHLGNVQRDEAKEKIDRSKAVAQELGLKSVAFRNMWQSARKQFQFCFDYCTGAIKLAEEVEGEVVWLVK